MRLILNNVHMDGVIIIGEGEKDEAPMLYNGEKLGTGDLPSVDIAVDPIDGTTATAKGRVNAISVVSLAPRGSMFDPGPFMYMNKIAVGPEAKDVIDIEAPIIDNLNKIAKAKGMKTRDLTVMILDRERHNKIIHEVRDAGARIRLIDDGDVISVLKTTMDDSVIDVMLGVGGTPEGVIAACGLRCYGGNMQGKLYPRNQSEIDMGKKMGYDIDKVLTIDDLVSSDNVFFAATGITGGDLLDGVDYYPDGALTDSVVARGLTGTVRRIRSRHKISKLRNISAIEY